MATCSDASCTGSYAGKGDGVAAEGCGASDGGGGNQWSLAPSDLPLPLPPSAPPPPRPPTPSPPPPAVLDWAQNVGRAFQLVQVRSQIGGWVGGWVGGWSCVDDRVWMSGLVGGRVGGWARAGRTTHRRRSRRCLPTPPLAGLGVLQQVQQPVAVLQPGHHQFQQ